MSLGGRRAGPAMRFDVFNDSTGAVVARNLTAAEVVASHLTSVPNAQTLIDRVAAEHHVVSDSKRAAAHNSIHGGALYGTF